MVISLDFTEADKAVATKFLGACYWVLEALPFLLSVWELMPHAVSPKTAAVKHMNVNILLLNPKRLQILITTQKYP